MFHFSLSESFIHYNLSVALNSSLTFPGYYLSGCRANSLSSTSLMMFPSSSYVSLHKSLPPPHPTSAETRMWGTATGCHAGCQEFSRCQTRAESQGTYITYTSTKCE